MPEVSIRFGIRSSTGACSNVWKSWSSRGAGKRDVYLASRPLGTSALKLSLHEHGQWHVGFDRTQKNRLFAPGTEPPTRFLGQWARASTIGQAFVLAARVFFPWSSPSISRVDAPPDTVWIPVAPEGKMVEVAVILMAAESPTADWPAKDTISTELVGRIPLEGAGEVTIVHRLVPMFTDAAPRQGTPNYFRGRSKDDLLTADRMVAWGEAPDGSNMYIESKVSVSGASAA